MIKLQAVHKEDHDLLYNINQKYLYEMTNFYDDPMDRSGNYGYGHFEEYFTDPKRKAFFLYNNQLLVGFAMICPYSYFNAHPDYVMAEFTVFPAYRRKHYAFEAANQILAEYPGLWEIKYNEKNLPAKKLWTAVTAPYHPIIQPLNDEETVLIFRTVLR